MAERASVVVITRQRAPSLRETLAALAALDYAEREIIVVDNGSTDETPAVVEAAGARLVRTLPRAGISGSRQAGLEAARGAVVAFCDDDCLPRPDWLSRLVERLEADPGIGLLAGRIVNEGFEGGRRFKGRTRLGPNAQLLFVEDPKDAEFYGNANLAFRRRVAEEIGGYDPFFVAGRAEIDLAQRIRAAGYRVEYEPHAVLVHRHYPVEYKHGRLFYGHQTMRLYLLFKHWPPRGGREWGRFWKVEAGLFGREVGRTVRALGADLLHRRVRSLPRRLVELANAVLSRAAVPLLWRRARR